MDESRYEVIPETHKIRINVVVKMVDNLIYHNRKFIDVKGKNYLLTHNY
jgi:hypothetical protein